LNRLSEVFDPNIHVVRLESHVTKFWITGNAYLENTDGTMERNNQIKCFPHSGSNSDFDFVEKYEHSHSLMALSLILGKLLLFEDRFGSIL